VGALAGAALFAASAALAQSEPAPAALRVRLGVTDGATRVVVDSPARLSARPETAGADELAFTLTGAEAASDLSGAGKGLVGGWRLQAGAEGARLTLRLTGAAAVTHRFAMAPGEGAAGWRYVIDLAAPGAAPAPSKPVLAKASSRRHATLVRPAVRAVPRPAPKVVVIDAGHGGHDPGAQSGGASEKDITLAAALELRRRLEASGRYKVVMTRASDVFIPLEERVKIARRAGADLFIALHADSAPQDPKAHGASVYTLSDHGETRVGQVLDGHEWFAHARGDAGTRKLLLDLTQRSTLNRSSQFAGLLVDALSDHIDLLPHSHRDAGYFVLLAPDVPAVLLEMGFITSPADQARLTDPDERRELMNAVGAAIDAYFTPPTRVAIG
jgi:N-acetylmuramoyl-L-alanine amidase